MLGSPLATSERGIDIVTNERVKNAAWKTAGIDVRHWARFLRDIEFKLERELSVYWNS